LLSGTFGIDNGFIAILLEGRNNRSLIWSVTDLLIHFELALGDIHILPFLRVLNGLVQILILLLRVEHFANRFVLSHASIHAMQI
jgi:hypothetical protein